MKKFGNRFGRVYAWLGAIFALLSVAGLIVFLTNFPFGDVRAETLLNSKYYSEINETKTVSAADVTALDINVNASHVEIVDSESEEIVVTMTGTLYGTADNEVALTLEKIDGKVKIANPQRFGFNWGWSFGSLFGPLTVRISLPAKNYESLRIVANASDVKHTAAAEFGEIKLDLNASSFAGALKTDGVFKMVANASNADLDLSAGSIDVDLSASDIDFNVEAFCTGTVFMSASTVDFTAPFDEDAKVDFQMSASSLKDGYFGEAKYSSNITLGQGSKLLSVKGSASDFEIRRAQ